MNLLVLKRGVLDRIRDDVEAMTSFVGGVYSTPITPPLALDTYGPGPGPDGATFRETPDAFEEAPPYGIRTCASLRISGKQRHPSGGWDRLAHLVEIRYYTPDSDAGEEAGNAGMARVLELLTRYPVFGPGEPGWLLEPAQDAIPFELTTEFPKAQAAVERFYATYMGG